MSGIVDWLASIAEGVSQIPSRIVSGITEFQHLVDNALTSLYKRLGNIVDNISSIPSNIEKKIKAIFIPDTDKIEASLNSFLNDLKMRFNFNTDAFNTLFDGEAPVEDKKGSYNLPGVGSLNLTFLDTKFLVQGVAYFRPFIRGFLVLLMFIFNIKMTLSFIRQDAGTVTGKAVSMGGNKE